MAHLPDVDLGVRRRPAALRDALRDARKLAEADAPLQDAGAAGIALRLRSRNSALQFHASYAAASKQWVCKPALSLFQALSMADDISYWNPHYSFKITAVAIRHTPHSAMTNEQRLQLAHVSPEKRRCHSMGLSLSHKQGLVTNLEAHDDVDYTRSTKVVTQKRLVLLHSHGNVAEQRRDSCRVVVLLPRWSW